MNLKRNRAIFIALCAVPLVVALRETVDFMPCILHTNADPHPFAQFLTRLHCAQYLLFIAASVVILLPALWAGRADGHILNQICFIIHCVTLLVWFMVNHPLFEAMYTPTHKPIVPVEYSMVPCLIALLTWGVVALLFTKSSATSMRTNWIISIYLFLCAASAVNALRSMPYLEQLKQDSQHDLRQVSSEPAPPGAAPNEPSR